MKLKRIHLLFLLFFSQHCTAVNISYSGDGEVLIFPYYTVNNGLNTLYTVVNTTPDTKALKVQFLEGDNSLEVLDFNVYLSAYDVWTGALIPSISNHAGHVGEPSAAHITSDSSCAPFLVKAPATQELLPFTIDTDIAASNRNMLRVREGHIQIIEMATFTGSAVDWADHGTHGVTVGCGHILGDLADNGMWDSGGEESPTGGLFGSASLIDVAQGINYTYDALALVNFWQGNAYHTPPGDLLPNISDAYPESKILLDSGEVVTSQWNTGFEAVSSVLMSAHVRNEYALEPAANGQSEWVVSYPTKRFHIENEHKAPFVSDWDGNEACEDLNILILDRNQQREFDWTCGVLCLPDDYGPKLCHSGNVVEFLLPGSTAEQSSRVLGSSNLLQVTTPSNASTQSGWALIDFLDNEHILSSLEGNLFYGLPTIGFSVQKYTNAQAGDGLLAQYGGAFSHKLKMEVEQ